jgi:hypothetical protein
MRVAAGAKARHARERRLAPSPPLMRPATERMALPGMPHLPVACQDGALPHEGRVLVVRVDAAALGGRGRVAGRLGAAAAALGRPAARRGAVRPLLALGLLAVGARLGPAAAARGLAALALCGGRGTTAANGWWRREAMQSSVPEQRGRNGRSRRIRQRAL